MDARNGEVLHSRSADRVLHPASLTKMMTLYVAFEAITGGEIGLDDTVRVSRNAASEVPSKIGLRAGQRISLRYLLRAAALKSANDAATAIGEAISGSETAFSRRMTDTARRLGMMNTSFRNANGLTAAGHLSTARDMSRLARHLIYDYPQYYNLFGAVRRHAGIATVRSTNRRLLNGYRGADGIKTGFTNAAGYNLAASAQRGDERIVAVIFGGRSSDWRYRRMVELLDMGFARAPSHATLVRPRVRQDIGAVMASIRPQPRAASRRGGETIVAAAQFVGSAFVSPASAAIDDGASTFTDASALSTSGRVAGVAPRIAEPPRPRTPGGAWAVQLGAYKQERTAERVVRDVGLVQVRPLSAGLTQVSPAEVRGMRLFEARFLGLTQTEAAAACAVLQEQSRICRVVAPERS